MTLKSKKRLLILLNGVLAAASVIVAAAAIWLPLPGSEQAVRPPVDDAGDETMSVTETGIGTVSYAVIHQTDLRKPLFDPAPVAAAPPAPPPKPKLEAVLTGTAVDPGSTFGIFRTRAGDTRLVEVGQVVDGAEVIGIEEGKATVRFHGDILVLTVKE